MANFKLTDITGIGPFKADTLIKNGIASVEQFANASLEELTKIPGFGASLTENLIKNAQTLLTQTAEVVKSAPIITEAPAKAQEESSVSHTENQVKATKDKKSKKADKKKDKKKKSDKKQDKKKGKKKDKKKSSKKDKKKKSKK